MNKLLLVLFFTAMGMFEGHSQALVQTYVDRCTGEVKVMTVPMNGQTVVTYYNRSRTFTAQDFTSGRLQSWLEETYLWWNSLSPCSTNTANAQATQQATQQTTQQATQAAANAASTAAANTTTNVPSTPVSPPPTTQTSQPTTTAPDTSSTNTNAQNTTGSGANTSSSGNSASTSGGSQNSQGGSETNSTSSNSSSGSENTSTDQNTESTSTETQNSESGTSGSEGSTEESTEVDNSTEENTTEETSTEESTEENNEETSNEETDESNDEETTEESNEEETDESTEEDKEEESSEEESTEEEDESSEDEDTEEESDDEGGKKDNKKKKKKRNLAPPVVTANVMSQELPTGGFSQAATFGISQSSLLGDKTYGLNVMVYDNLQQFMLNANYSKVHINKKGRISRVYSASLGGMKMFTTYMGMMNHSLTFLGKKGSVAGIALGVNITMLDVTTINKNIYLDSTILGASLTSFYTKPFQVNSKLTISPMVAVSSPFMQYEMFKKETAWNKDVMIISGASFTYRLTQRFGLNLGANIIESTAPNFPLMKTFTIGGRLSF